MHIKLSSSLIKSIMTGTLLTWAVAGNAALAEYSVVDGSKFKNGTSLYSTSFSDGTVATFTGSSAFNKKSQGGFTGVGINGGATAGEIDIGEWISGSFSKSVIVNSISLGLLFDGPEYGDVQEVSKINVLFSDGGSDSFTLTATGTHSAIWTGIGSVLSIGSGAVSGGSGAWQITNPFGSRSISSILFTANRGTPSLICPKCANQSDYTFGSMTVTPVSEASSSILMLTGLGLIASLISFSSRKISFKKAA